jgi:predicted acyl esterase
MMQMKKYRTWLGVLALCASATCGYAQGQQSPNGILDDYTELVTRKQIPIKMKDGVELATDIYLPITQDDIAFANIQIDAGPLLGSATPFPVTIQKLKLANRGLQLFTYPNQADPRQLPIIFTRTPYNKKDPEQGQFEALLGYIGVIQDMRGRYASGGVYLPMYSDSWDKTAYLEPKGLHHPLDTTRNHEASTHEDGYESVEYLAKALRIDDNGDGVVNEADRLLTNGMVGMVGGSALGNTQYQAAAAHYIDPSKPGLKCLLPIVASNEHWQSTGHHHGVYRERIIDGWLRGQVERYDFDLIDPDGSVYNKVHSLHDYGPTIGSAREAAETAIDFWTTMYKTHYPNGPGRGVMDASFAPLDENGNPSLTGTKSRYTNANVPCYHLTGWWDEFTDGQILTWNFMMKHTQAPAKNTQKLVIGPWAHQNIGSRTVGDMKRVGDVDHRYPVAVDAIAGTNLEALDIETLPRLASSEIVGWFRNHLGGEPTVKLPKLDEWQFVASFGDSIFVKMPAEDYTMSYTDFFNFIIGVGELKQFPVMAKGFGGLNPDSVMLVDIPATNISILGQSGVQLSPIDPVTGKYQFDASKPNSVPNARLYVVGPVADPQDGANGRPKAGNYWMASDTFPLLQIDTVTVHLHANGLIDTKAPAADEGTLVYVTDPNNPVPTHGGNNMAVKTPDNQRDSQGQMNFTDPQYVNQVLNRPLIEGANGQFYKDMLAFETTEIVDSFNVTGFSVITLHAQSTPISSVVADSGNCDFIVRILDVYPDGREYFAFEGAVNARFRQYAMGWLDGVENPNAPINNIPTDRILEYKFRALPICYTFGHGHKIKVLVSGTNYPRYQACPNLPLEPGEFFRRRPYEDKTYNFRGTELYPRKTMTTLAFGPTTGFKIDFPSKGKRLETVTSREQASAKPTMEVKIYPNPATDAIAVTVGQLGTYQARLYDMLGREMLSASFAQTGLLNVSQLAKGFYVLKVIGEAGEISSQKVAVN